MLPEPNMLDRAVAIARAAGTVVMEVYATEFKVAGKSDASPVSKATNPFACWLRVFRITPYSS